MEQYQKRLVFQQLNFGTPKRMPPSLANTIMKFHSVPVTVKRYFTDIDGQVIAKNTVPVALQTYYPFFVFGDFDRAGGYNTALKAIPPAPGTYYLTSFMNANGLTAQQITGFTGFNTVRNFIQHGDIVFVYTDNINAPNYFIWVVISTGYGSIASIVGNTETSQNDGLLGKLYVDFFKYFTDNNFEQFSTPLHFTRSSNIATWSDNQVQPYIYKSPLNEQQNFVDIHCAFNMDQFLSIGTKFNFNTEEINFLFRLGTPKK